MPIFATLSVVVTAFIVQVGAGFAGYTPSGDFVVPSAAVIAASASIAGATPLGAITGVEE